jgi:TolA-binding protein
VKDSLGEKISEALEAYQSKNYEETLQILEDFSKDYPLSKRAEKALFKMGYIYTYNLSNYEKAREIFQRIIDSYPDWNAAPSSLYYLGVIEDLEGNKESAHLIHQELLKKYPQTIWADNIKISLKKWRE